MEKTVSVVIPCRNEERFIQRLLVALSKQSYSLENIEIIIADGESQDKTIKLIRTFISKNPKLKIKIVNNSKKNIPAALNLAIKSSYRRDYYSYGRPFSPTRRLYKILR